MGQAGSKQEMFWEACGFGRAHLVQMFIEHGIDVNWVSSVHACSPIHVASQGKPDVALLLINAGCDLTVVDSRRNTAVHHAAMQGHADIIQMLADAGADINAQDKNGWTPLHCAAYYGHLKAVEVLLRNKCDTSILNKDGRSALVETARSKTSGLEKVLGEIARQLIKAGCDVDLKCADLGEANFTGLMFAAYHNHLDVANAFIEGSCDLNCASCYTRWTALHWAADCGNAEMVRLLLEAGADPTRMGMRGELASNRAKDDDVKDMLENAVKAWQETVCSLSSAHSVNAQASLDTARALESLSTHAKNRDILSAPMPTIPALGISSRSDPKIRYTKRSVTEVAKKSQSSVFSWKSYSKQGSPSPDKDGVKGALEKELEKRKMFPMQDDKTNAFMDTLAQRITYMTNKIASMSNAVVGQRDPISKGGECERKSSSDETSVSKFTSGADDNSEEDSGLSTLEGSEITSELATPDDGLTYLGESLNQSSPRYVNSRSPKSSSFHTSSMVDSSSRDDALDEEADACIIEASHRGFSILHALQERHRRSLYLEDVAIGVQAGGDLICKTEIMSEV